MQKSACEIIFEINFCKRLFVCNKLLQKGVYL